MTTADVFLPSGGLDRTNPVTSKTSHANGYIHGYHDPSSSSPSHAHRQYHNNYNHNPSILAPFLDASNSDRNGFPPSALPPQTLSPNGISNKSTIYPPNLPGDYNYNYPYQSMLQHANLVPRSTTVSPPTRTARRNSPPILPPDVNGAAFLYRSVSADTAALPQTHSPSNHHLVQRLAQQNALIREAWEAERNYLEANRRRAEEVYQEERVIMEEVREGWENEKAAMASEMQVLKERIQRLEGENHTLRAVAAQSVQVTGVVSPQASLRGDSVDNVSAASGPAASGPAAFIGKLPLQGLPQPQLPHHPLHAESDPLSLPPGLDGASRRPHFAKPGSSRTSPTEQPESSPFIPLDPRMQPQTSSARDFLNSSSTDESDTPVPVIDIQEVDPKLEGIPLKATAVQKFTFSTNKDSANGSPATSPPAAGEHYFGEKPRPMAIKRLSSKDHTIQVLQAEESRRLTMHAGHTPNHSLSLFPTMSIAASSTGAPQDDETPDQISSAPDVPAEPEPAPEPAVADDEPDHVNKEVDEEGHPEEILEAQGDVKLKGPLMIKNIPAQDEIFWDQVNKKLEPISQGRDALPTVMRASLGDQDLVVGVVPGVEALRQVAPVGGDASHDSGADVPAGEAEVSGQKGVERDIPLKLKSTTNFGAPFGMA